MIDSSKLRWTAGGRSVFHERIAPIVGGSTVRERYGDGQPARSMSDGRSTHVPTASQMAIRGRDSSRGDAARDFAIAEEVCSAAQASHLTIAAEPIYNVDNPDLILYRECFPWLLDSHGEPLPPETFMPSLERTGMVRWFDRYIVRRVIRALRDQPDLILGVNISALSAVEDAPWTSTLIDLQQSPDIAGRLVLEISENTPLTLGRARRFGNMLRQLGCAIAIDDFGVAYGVETNIAIDRPDIIKIDASFRDGISTDTNMRSRLAGMIRIASDMSPTVIVEGVEHEADIEHIRDAGALWAQGRCFERQCPCLV
ncbi:EAL domain-containing protein [Burkholderia ubonensis]|uniref:EAL domain-containing protein n=1 Tax=Burkholderia ubonensis TaxID=101571 RepID=UPI0009B303E7|nr:EAL domain-containing protein [Burkholderia ubonensis]